MKKRIYYSLIGISLITIVLMTALSGYFLYRSTATQVSLDLTREIQIIADQFVENRHDTTYLQEVADRSRKEIRLTWIDGNGTVLYDTQQDPLTMENHLHRPEIQKALKTGQGEASRISNTIDTSTHYLAEKLPNNTILRIAMERKNVYAAIHDILLWGALILIILILLTFYAGRRLTKKLLQPVEDTLSMMQHIRHDTKTLPRTNTYPEIQPFIQKIEEQNTTIRRTIRTLAEERNIMRLMLAQIQEGFVLLNADHNVVAANHWAKNFLTKHGELDIENSPISTLRYAETWQAIIAETTAHTPHTKRNIREGERQYQISCQYIEKIKKKPGILLVITDMTEQERREQLRREFTSNVSHELKTPLTSIRGFAEMISAGLYNDRNDLEHFASLIQGESKRLLHLIDALIHLSHIEEANKEMKTEPVSLRPMTEELRTFLEPLCKEKNITLTVSGEEGEVEGNKALLRELCMNLIDNAIKYNIVGGTVAVTIQKKDNTVQYEVKDTGIGIPKDKQQQVFERFYRVDKSRAKATGGSGLGLAIVKHIAEKHHGTITMQSKENEGTTITVILPIRP